MENIRGNALIKGRRFKCNMYRGNNITIFDLYMRLILIMPITTLFQNQIDAINKIVFVTIFLLQIYLLVKTKMTPNYVLLTLIALVVYVTGLINTTNLKFDNTIVYYINWIVYYTVSFLWATIIEHFNRLPLWNRIIGGGYNFSRNLLGHYAYNDFIEILATHGYSGVLLYLYSIIQLFKNYFENHPRKILVVSAVTIWLFNAMFNMFYYYICAALSFPFLLFAIDWYSNEKEII